MNRIATITAVTTLLLAPAAGFAAEKAAEKAPPAAKAEKAAPAPKAEAAPPAAKAEPASKPEAEKMASADKPKRGPSRAREDARVCLEQATNREVAICAEKFR